MIHNFEASLYDHQIRYFADLSVEVDILASSATRRDVHEFSGEGRMPAASEMPCISTYTIAESARCWPPFLRSRPLYL